MRLRIKTEQLLPRLGGEVWLDSLNLSDRVQGVSISFDRDDVTLATIKLHIDELDIDAETLAMLEAHVATQDAP